MHFNIHTVLVLLCLMQFNKVAHGIHIYSSPKAWHCRWRNWASWTGDGFLLSHQDAELGYQQRAKKTTILFLFLPFHFHKIKDYTWKVCLVTKYTVRSTGTWNPQAIPGSSKCPWLACDRGGSINQCWWAQLFSKWCWDCRLGLWGEANQFRSSYTTKHQNKNLYELQIPIK